MHVCVSAIVPFTHQKNPPFQEKTHLTSIPPQRKRAIVRPVGAEAQPLPHHRAVRRQIRSARQHGPLLIVPSLARVRTLGEDGDDGPVVELEGFGLEVAEGDGFVEVGPVDALEGTDGLGGSGGVVVVGVGERAAWNLSV